MFSVIKGSLNTPVWRPLSSNLSFFLSPACNTKYCKYELNSKTLEAVNEFQMSPNNYIYLNREKELLELYETNSHNNVASKNGVFESQVYNIPCYFHTYGAGKTQLGINYIEKMKETISEKKETEDMKEIFIRLYAPPEQKISAETVIAKITRLLKPSKELDFFETLNEYRSKNGLFVLIDELGELKDYSEFIALKDSFANYFASGPPKDLKPLHIYFCGRLPKEFRNQAIQAVGRSAQKRIFLPPLFPQHIEQIYNHINKEGDWNISETKENENEIKEIIFNQIFNITAGIPRNTWKLLLCLKYQKQKFPKEKKEIKEILRSYAFQIAKEFPEDSANLSDIELTDFLVVTGMEELDISFDMYNDIELIDMCRYLPFMLVEQKENKTYKIKSAPIFSVEFGQQVIQQYGKLTMKEFGNIPFRGIWKYQKKKYANSRKYNIAYNLLTNLTKDLFLAKLNTDRETGDLMKTKLYTLFPFLKKIENFIPNCNIEMMFKISNSEIKYLKNHTPEEKFENCIIQPGLHISVDQSCIGDLFVSLKQQNVKFCLENDGKKEEFSVVNVEIQIIAAEINTGDKIGILDIKEEIKKMALSKNLKEMSLFILIVDTCDNVLTQELETNDGFLFGHSGELKIGEPNEIISIPENALVLVMSSEGV